MTSRRGLIEALAAPAPKGLALAAAIPFLVLALVATAGALAIGGPKSQRILEEHIRRKQRFLYLKRTKQIPPKVKFDTWEKREYPRKRPVKRTTAHA